MKRKTSGVVLFATFAVMVMCAQGVLAGGPVQTITACLKVNPGEPLGTAVYSWWDEEMRRLEITVAGVENDGNYCIFVDKVKLAAKLTVVDGAGYLKLDTRFGDEIPLIELGSKMALKYCLDTSYVLCGSFK